MTYNFLLMACLLIDCCIGAGFSCMSKHYELSEREKVIFLFSTFDISKKNGYLSYYEIELFQRLTDPQLPLDMTTYRYIIRLLGGHMQLGINLDQFNSSYYLYKNTLGTDLNKDYRIISSIIRGAM